MSTAEDGAADTHQRRYIMKWRVIEFMGGKKHDRNLWADTDREAIEILWQDTKFHVARIQTYCIEDGKAVFRGERLKGRIGGGVG